MRAIPLRARPVLIWKTLRVTAGLAYYRENSIGLSRNLLVDEQRLRSTLVHEYAHLVAVERYGRKAAGHGPHWRKAMQELGAPPERTHCYEVQRNERRQVVTYICTRCGAKFERSRRFPKRRKYLHVNCGGGLRLMSVEKVTNRSAAP